MAILTEFRPSIWGWPFSNIGIGWCGGFCYSVLDRYYSTGNPPPDEGTLETNSQLKDRIFRKQIQAVERYGGVVAKWQMRPDTGQKINSDRIVYPSEVTAHELPA